MSEPNELTGFNTRLKSQDKQSCIPLAVSEAAGIQDEHGQFQILPENLECPTKAVCAYFAPLPPLEGHTAQWNPKPSGRKDLSSITATSVLQSARDILLCQN